MVLGPEDLLTYVRAAHARELELVDRLTEEQARGTSALPGWTRGHVLAARLAFLRAARRQIEYALSDRSIEFYTGGRPGREAEIAAYADRPADELVSQLRQELAALERAWARVGPSDWERPVTYREGGRLPKLLMACWRESEVLRVDLELGASCSDWSPELCDHLFEFLALRVPEGVQLELTTPEGATWRLGAGERVQVRGAVTDLAAWLAGRRPAGVVESSTGSLPELRRLRDA